MLTPDLHKYMIHFWFFFFNQCMEDLNVIVPQVMFYDSQISTDWLNFTQTPPRNQTKICGSFMAPYIQKQISMFYVKCTVSTLAQMEATQWERGRRNNTPQNAKWLNHWQHVWAKQRSTSERRRERDTPACDHMIPCGAQPQIWGL